mgnify:CR=1 FL=1
MSLFAQLIEYSFLCPEDSSRRFCKSDLGKPRLGCQNEINSRRVIEIDSFRGGNITRAYSISVVSIPTQL